MTHLQTFDQRRLIALAILAADNRLTRKAGSFLGQLAVDPTPMTSAQEEWLEKLAERAGLKLDGEIAQ